MTTAPAALGRARARLCVFASPGLDLPSHLHAAWAGHEDLGGAQRSVDWAPKGGGFARVFRFGCLLGASTSIGAPNKEETWRLHGETCFAKGGSAIGDSTGRSRHGHGRSLWLARREFLVDGPQAAGPEWKERLTDPKKGGLQRVLGGRVHEARKEPAKFLAGTSHALVPPDMSRFFSPVGVRRDMVTCC